MSHLRLDKSSDATLRRSVYTCVRDAIADGRLRAGSRLPSTRLLASELALSRNTVAEAFAQLIAEGYVLPRRGSGTFVAPVRVESVRANGSARTLWERASARGRMLAAHSSDTQIGGRSSLPFQPGVPAYEYFPFDIWARTASKVMRRPNPELLGYGDSAGYGPLREVIAAELRARSGIACRLEQVIVVGGTSQALDLVCRLVLDPGDAVWLEDPSSLYARSTLLSAGAALVPVPVDSEGLVVAAGRKAAAGARLAHVTSAHQWPTGATMSAARRTELLRWADEADAWIVEDEYDGIFRYDGARPASLASLDRSGRVIAIGSFSVTTFPSIRLGYVIAPPTLVDAFVAAKATADRQAALFDQATLAEFMFDGHYARYRTHMRSVYAERQERLISRIDELTGIGAPATGAGLHVVLPLEETVDDVALSRAARAASIAAPALSAYHLAPTARRGLILGFGAGTRLEMERAAVTLCRDVMRAPFRRTTTRLARDIPG